MPCLLLVIYVDKKILQILSKHWCNLFALNPIKNLILASPSCSGSACDDNVNMNAVNSEQSNKAQNIQ